MSDKKALVIKRADLQAISEEGEFLLAEHSDEDSLITLDTPSYFNGLYTELVSRSICETDPSLLQLLPYVTLVRGSSVDNMEVYTYVRGKGGDESRLHNVYSLGLGGHVDTAPAEGVPLLEHLAHEAAREVNEEVGVPVTDNLIKELQECLENPLLIYTNRDEVSKVHLGLWVPLHLKSIEHDTVDSQEHDTITDGGWVKLSELVDEYTAADGYDCRTFEAWSDMAIKFFIANIADMAEPELAN